MSLPRFKIAVFITAREVNFYEICILFIDTDFYESDIIKNYCHTFVPDVHALDACL